jgi:hypothetical protein
MAMESRQCDSFLDVLVFRKEVPQYAKICVMKLVASDMTISLTVIPKGSLTQLLTPRAAVVRVKRKSSWALWISHM